MFNDPWREQYTNTTISRMLQRLVVDNWDRDKAFAETLDVLNKIYAKYALAEQSGGDSPPLTIPWFTKQSRQLPPGPGRHRVGGRVAQWSRQRRELLGGLLLLTPALLILLGLVIYPFFYAIWLSFLEKSVGTVGQFVGLRNFSYVITWPQFQAALKNTAVFTIVAIVIKFVLGMSVALVLNQHIRGRNFFRAFLLLPWVIPAFVVYLTWRWLYDPLQGLLNYALLDAGLITRPIAFLSDKSTAMISVIIAHAWRGFPFFAISFLAGMQTISLELYEAAQVDGATRWQQFRHITLPSLYHIIGVVLLLADHLDCQCLRADLSPHRRRPV